MPKRGDEYTFEIPVIGKVYLGLVSLETILLIVVALWTLFGKLAGDVNTELAFYGAIGLFVTLWQLYFAIDAIFQENIFQLWASIFSAGLVWLWSLYHQFTGTISLTSLFDSLSTVLLVVTSLFFVVFLVMGYFVQESFGWRAYKKLGASAELQSIYRTYQIFVTLLKIDTELAILIILLGSFFLFTSALQSGLNVLALVVTIVYAIFGYFAVRNEWKKCCWIFGFFSIIEPIVIGLYLSQVIKTPEVTVSQFAITGGLALFCRVLLLVCLHFCYINFHFGLMRVHTPLAGSLMKETDTESENLATGGGNGYTPP